MVSITVLCLSGLWFVLPESPRWLLAVNKKDEAISVLKEGAEMNKRTLSQKNVEMVKNSGAHDGAESSEVLGLKSLFSEWNVLKNTLIICINFLVITMCYYGLTMHSVNLGSTNIYVNFVLSAVIEIPSYVFASLILDRIGRKTTLIVCQTIAGASCIIAGVIQDTTSEVVITVLTLLGTINY